MSLVQKILIVDDDRGSRHLIKKSLKDFDIIEAGDGEEALKKITSESPDLVLLDHKMPKMDGLDGLEFIMKNNPNSKCIMITGEEVLSLAVEALKKGAVDFIIKPFDPIILNCTVEKVLKNEDLKKQKEMTLVLKNAELEKINCELDNFVHTVSHDLRAPLRGIAGNADYRFIDII